MLLKKYRETNELSQKDLADKLDVSPSIISYWEDGKRTPRLGMIWRICKALDVSLYDLLRDEIDSLEEL